MFELRNFCVAWSGRPVISDLCLSAPSPGALSLVGPCGVGKSSLLRAVAGGCDMGLSVRGDALLDGAPCHAAPLGVGWYRQQLGIGVDGRRVQGHGGGDRHARSARRLRALDDFIATRRSLYVLDEPTAGMTGEHAAQAREWLGALARQAFVLMATHNREDCIAVGGIAAILDAGAVVEEAPAAELFTRPRTPAGRHYAVTGNLAGLRPWARPPCLDGICWVVPGLLCGLSRPGLVAPAGWQYRHLAGAGVRHLVSLEERAPGAGAMRASGAFGIALHHCRVADMGAPDFAQALDFCQLAEAAITDGQGIAFHCRSGLGRTGTALAAVLIWFGEAVDVAIARVRAAQGCAIRSPVQKRFLGEFAECVGDRRFPEASSHPDAGGR